MKSISLILCILFTPVNLVFSQEFSLEQLIETAIIRNLTLKIEKENLKQEEIGLTNANRLRWPTLNANASTSNNLSDQSSSVSLRLTQPLYQGGAIADQQSIADFELKKATLAYTR
ncbi:MAG TPA: hypothetical protein ENK06_13000, partial [Gammaproteobacteria bacterium]|nr:hypothetical protein [Gammaproteobacteria bacterium]